MDSALKITDTLTRMHKEAVKAFKNSYSPYTNFAVGASVLDQNGNITSGCNVENPCHAGVCAERTAINYAVSQGLKKIEAVVVVTDQKDLIYPCGVCLQTMAEFCSDDLPIYLGDLKGIKAKHTFKELMPFAYHLKKS